MRVLICMLYSTGLRLGEALRLRWADVDWKERCFFIRMSKGRSRWVSFRIDLRQELEHYVQERRRYVGDDPESFRIDQSGDGLPGRDQLPLVGGQRHEGAQRRIGVADLTLDVAALSAAYLGGARLRDAVLAKGVDEHRPGALAEADALFRTAELPWCSTGF